MAPQEELARLISEKGRKILVAENPVDLKSLQGENFVYLLQLPEGSTAAGGRAGGFGERRVERLYAFHYSNGSCRKLFEVDSPEKLKGSSFLITRQECRFSFPTGLSGLSRELWIQNSWPRTSRSHSPPRTSLFRRSRFFLGENY